MADGVTEQEGRIAPTTDDLAAWAEDCRNWGRWGDEDEIGTLNLVDGMTITAAREEIRTGQSIGLAIDFGQSGPQINGHGRRFNPIHWMLSTGSEAYAIGNMCGYADDVIETPIHGATHWDGLAHVFYDGKMWNGYDMRLCGVAGSTKNAITQVRDRLVGRAVLADVARFKGVEALAPGQGILVSDVEACLEAEGVELRPADFLLVRTGQLGWCQREGWGDYCFGAAPGLSLDTATWIKRRDLAAIATDTFGAEVRPNETAEMTQPWHHVVIPNVGITVGEMFALDRLADACEHARRYSFFLAAGALPIERATGSPVNPIAVL